MLTNSVESKLLRTVSKLYYIALAVVIYQVLIKYDLLSVSYANIFKGYLFVSLLLGIAVRIYSAYIWIFLLKAFGSTEKMTLQLIYVYSKAWLGRYIPGKLPWIMGKIYFATKFNLSKKRLLACSLLETGLQVMVAGLTGGVLLIVSGRSTGIPYGFRWLVGAIFVLLIAILPKHIAKLIRTVYLKIKRDKINEICDVPVRVISRTVYMFLIVAILSGLSYYFLILSISENYKGSLMVYTIGAVNFAGAVGMVSIFAPSGLGVREGVLAFTLKDVINAGEIAKIVIFSRLWAIALDLAFFASSLIVYKFSNCNQDINLKNYED